MRVLLYLALLPLLAGCGLMTYRTEIYQDGEKRAEVRSNVPSKATFQDMEVDQRSPSLLDRWLERGQMLREDK